METGHNAALIGFRLRNIDTRLLHWFGERVFVEKYSYIPPTVSGSVLDIYQFAGNCQKMIGIHSLEDAIFGILSSLYSQTPACFGNHPSIKCSGLPQDQRHLLNVNLQPSFQFLLLNEHA
jgi:hypothetical protein